MIQSLRYVGHDRDQEAQYRDSTDCSILNLIEPEDVVLVDLKSVDLY